VQGLADHDQTVNLPGKTLTGQACLSSGQHKTFHLDGRKTFI
jgi:hypothetical protein